MDSCSDLDDTDLNLKIQDIMLEENICVSVGNFEAVSNENFIDSAMLDSNKSEDVLNNHGELVFEDIIGYLEDMLIDENFYTLQNSFLEKYWEEFDDTEENKHSYMTIFNEYTSKLEDFIENYLKERISNFDMNTFASQLEEKKDLLDGEIFEVLLTLSDFKAFKEIFLDYRAMKEGRTKDLSQSLLVTSLLLK